MRDVTTEAGVRVAAALGHSTRTPVTRADVGLASG